MTDADRLLLAFKHTGADAAQFDALYAIIDDILGAALSCDEAGTVDYINDNYGGAEQ